MASLGQAIERQRERGMSLPGATVSGNDLHARFRPTPPGSMRALIAKMLEGTATSLPWAVILCRFKGAVPDDAVEGPIERFYREAFTPGSGGLVEYWRDASLGAVDIAGSKVFGWVEIEIPRDRAGGAPSSNPPGPGRAALIDYAVNAVKRGAGDHALDGLLGPIAVYTQNWSRDGAPPGVTWETPGWFQYWIDGSADGTGRVALTPPHNGNITAHEMGHVLDMGHDVGPDLTTHYRDPCCIMSQNGAFTHPRWGVNFGPAICLPHLMQRNWMFKRRVLVDDGDWLSQPNGITVPLAPIIRPTARANLGMKLAFTGGNGNWDYYLEYVVPSEWNRGVPGAPFVVVRRIVSIPGSGDHPAYLGAMQVPATSGPTAEFVEPSGNIRFRVKLTDLPGPIVKIHAQKL